MSTDIGSRRKEKLDYLKRKSLQFAYEFGPIDKIPLLLKFMYAHLDLGL